MMQAMLQPAKALFHSGKPVRQAAKATVNTADYLGHASAKMPMAANAGKQLAGSAAASAARRSTGSRFLSDAVEANLPQPSLSYTLMNNRKVPVSRRSMLKVLAVNAARGNNATSRAVVNPDVRRLMAFFDMFPSAVKTSPEGIAAASEIGRRTLPKMFLKRNGKRLRNLSLLGAGTYAGSEIAGALGE